MSIFTLKPLKASVNQKAELNLKQAFTLPPPQLDHILWIFCLGAFGWEIWAVSLHEVVQDAQCQSTDLKRWDPSPPGLSSSWMTLLGVENSLCLKRVMNILRTFKDLSFSSSVLISETPSSSVACCICFTLLKHWSFGSQSWKAEVFCLSWKLRFKWNHVVTDHQCHRYILAEIFDHGCIRSSVVGIRHRHDQSLYIGNSQNEVD